MNLPANLEAEKAVLGSILLDNTSFSRIDSVVSCDDFSSDVHRRLFARMAELYDNQQPIDAVTLTDLLMRKSELEVVGGVLYLTALTEGLPRSVNIRHYANIVHQKYLLRKIIQFGNRVMQEASGSDAYADEIFDMCEMQIARLRSKTSDFKFRSLMQVPLIGDIKDVAVEWLVESFIALKSLTLLSGMRGSYKSWLSLDMGARVANGAPWAFKRCMRRPVLYLDRENGEAIVNTRKSVLNTGSPENLHYWGMWEDDRPAGIADSRLRDFAKDYEPLIIFDSFIRFAKCKENDSQAISEVMERLRDLVSLGATVLVIAHKSDKPGSPDYRGSSDMAAACDIAWKMERREEDRSCVDLTCIKNRYVEEGKFSVQVATGGFIPIDGAQYKGNVADVLRRKQ